MYQDIHWLRLLLIVRFPLEQAPNPVWSMTPMSNLFQQSRDPICLIYMLCWSIPILTTCLTLILSSLCLDQCPNERLFPYLLCGQSCFTLILICLICYLRHGNDHWLVNSGSIIIFLIYFISFVCTSIFTFRRINDVTPLSSFRSTPIDARASTDCLSYCYPIGIVFFLIQLLMIICPLPLTCAILLLVMRRSLTSIDATTSDNRSNNKQQSTHV